MGSPQDKHDCRLNFRGTAKAMEADLGAELIVNSTILKQSNMRVRVVIGDEDASTMAAVRGYSQHRIFKICDRNHLNKNFSGEIFRLKLPKWKELAKDTIAHIRKCFSYAVAQNQGQSEALRETLLAIPDHLFGCHEKCQAWCQAVQKKTPTVTLTNTKLYDLLKASFFKYSKNAHKFSIAGSSQANESLNSIMGRKCLKQHCYSLSESADTRFASSVLAKNEGDEYILEVLNQRGLKFSDTLKKILKRTRDAKHSISEIGQTSK